MIKEKQMNKNKKLANMAMLVALAMIFSYVESLMPINFGIPGMKLGVANLVTVTGMYFLEFPEVFLVVVMRILLIGFLFGNGMSIVYSLAGGILSFLVMALMKRLKGFSVAGVSIAGGVSHNIGQIIVASVVVENLKLIYHLVKENGMTLAGAAKRLRQNREGVSRDLEIIEKLQRDGFLECSRKTDDRRSVFLHITKKGEEALVQWEETCARLEEEMLQGFDRSEQDQFYDFLLRAYDNLNEGKGDEQGA